MTDTSPLTMCGTAFTAVFFILSFLAAMIRLITVVFPQRPGRQDIALYGAIASAVAVLFPGARVTHVEEES